MLLSVQKPSTTFDRSYCVYSFYHVQIKMNAPIMKKIIVTPTPFVPTLKGRMSVAALVDIREMVETARVNIFSFAVR